MSNNFLVFETQEISRTLFQSGRMADDICNDQQVTSNSTNNVEYIEETATSTEKPVRCNIVSGKKSESYIHIEQNDEPLNEFNENDQLLYSAFPHLFPLGKGLRGRGSVSQKDMNHIESQWHGKFSNCLRLLFLFFDQWQRHAITSCLLGK